MTAAQQSATYKVLNIESNDRANVIDIRNGVVAMSYYEDIFSPTVTVMNDLPIECRGMLL